MKGKLNIIPKKGDKIVCLHMDGETSVPPGTTGTVRKVSRDPFEKGEEFIIDVNWDNDSSLSLVSSIDAWKLIEESSINEQEERTWNYITQNEDIFENFDWRFLREFLYKLRESSIVNMFAASPLLYAGREHIERYYGEGREDDENFQAVLEDADEAKNKIIQGVLKYMEKNNKSLDDLSRVNSYARNFAQKILGLYIAFSEFRN